MVEEQQDKFSARVFLGSAILVVSLVVATIFSVNCIVDPLWHFDGNRISDVNYGFNERVSRFNQLNKSIDEYNCIVFGSSVSTVIDPSRLKDYKCYNFSFSAGDVGEFIVLANYFKQRGFNPEAVFVEMNFSFGVPGSTIDRLPAHILKGEEPPGPWVDYLALEPFFFSLRALLNSSPSRRAYDQNFVGYVLPSERSVQPKEGLVYLDTKPLTDKNLEAFRELRAIYPDVRLVGFMHPMHAYHVARYYLAGVQEDFLNLMVATSLIFDEVYDFSIPSKITTDPTNTFDGSHFFEEIYVAVAQRLSGQTSDFGVLLDDPVSYKSLYKQATVEFVATLKNTPKD